MNRRRRRSIPGISLVMGLIVAITVTAPNSAWAPNCGVLCSVNRSARVPVHGTAGDETTNTTITLDGVVHLASQAILTDTATMLTFQADIANADIHVTAASDGRAQAVGASMIQDAWCAPVASESKNSLALTLLRIPDAPKDPVHPGPFKVRFTLALSCTADVLVGEEEHG